MASQITTEDRLDGWDAISAYLGWHVRTVIRWEKQKGLPVHRVPGGKRQPVYAFRHEIDLWFKSTNGAEAKAASAVMDSHQVALESPAATATPAAPRTSQLPIYGGLTLAILLIASLGIAWLLRVKPAMQVTGITQLTDDGTAKTNLATDGKQLYFGEYIDGEVSLCAMAVGGGPIRRIDVPPNLYPVAVSPNGKLLLALSYVVLEEERSLWVVPTAGGQPSQIAAHSRAAAWSPNGLWIAYSVNDAIYLSSPDGMRSRLLTKLDGIPEAIQWSADGKQILASLRGLPARTGSLWQIDLDDKLNARKTTPLSANGDAIDPGELLSRDESAYFAVARDATSDQVLSLRRRPWWRAGILESSTLSTRLGKIDGLAADPDAHRLFVLSRAQLKGELVQFEPSSQKFSLLLPGASGTFVDLTKNLEYATYVKSQDSSLWVSRSDGSKARQLSSSGMEVELPRWSPDGKWIAFMGKGSDRPWRVFIVPASVGPPKEASSGEDSQGAPTWSRDGKSLAYGNVYCHEMASCAIHTIDLASRKVGLVPGSQGLTTARWSPDGLHIAALNSVRRELYVFDLSGEKWRRLADAINGNDVSWSSDSKFVYAKTSMDGHTSIVRVAVGGGAMQTVLNLDNFSKSPGNMDTWFSLTPHNAVILNRWLNTAEIYALNY